MKKCLCLFLVVLTLWGVSGLAEVKTIQTSPVARHQTIEAAVTGFLQGEFKKQAREATDGWLRFLQSQGLSEVTMNLEKFDIEAEKPLAVTFLVAGGQAQLKTQPEYAGNPKTWLAGVLTAMQAHTATVKVSLLITQADGFYQAAYAPKAEAALAKSLAGIAKKAKSGFPSKSLLPVVVDLLMPPPMEVPKRAPEALDKAAFTPAFAGYLATNGLTDSTDLLAGAYYGLKGFSLDASGGPDALVLRYSAPDLSAMLSTTVSRLGLDLAYDAKAKEYAESELRKKLLSAFQADMIALRHGKEKGQPLEYSFSLLALPETTSPEAVYSHMSGTLSGTFSDALSTLQTKIWLFPDYPALPNPKTGLMSGESRGTSCILKVGNDSYSRYAVFFKAGTQDVVLTAFVESGKSAKIRLPKGAYDMVYGVGDVWYGPEHQFGDAGSYFIDRGIDIPGTNYRFTYTFNPKRNANREGQAIDPEDMMP